MLLIGNNLELLSSFAFTLTGVKTIITTKEPPQVIGKKLASVSTEIPVIILDVDQLQENLANSLAILRKDFPHAQVWALYHTHSHQVYNELLHMGFDNVLTLDDDLDSKVQEMLG